MDIYWLAYIVGVVSFIAGWLCCWKDRQTEVDWLRSELVASYLYRGVEEDS